MKAKILDVERLSVKRDGRYLLQDISFFLESMDILSVIGPAGAGKGLLAKTLLGIQRGEVTGAVRGSQKMGLVSNAYPCIENFSVFQNLALVARFTGVNSQTHLAEEIEEVLKSVNLWGELKFALHENVGTLNDFQKSRLDLARTLILKPNIVILDQPTLHFDPEKKIQYEAVIEKLRANMAFIWINHDLEQAARVSDKVAFLRDGRLVEFGSSESIFTMPVNPETENFISRRVYV
jgi:phosphate transport system ATP-binding protein